MIAVVVEYVQAALKFRVKLLIRETDEYLLMIMKMYIYRPLVAYI